MGPAARETRKRKRAEKAAERQQLMSELRATGAACATCKHFAKYPGPEGRNKRICELTSDFYGYTSVIASDLCLSYSERAK